MTRNTRGLTRSVIALMVPPLPAPSRPSKTTQTFRPLCLTHSCSRTSSTCSLASALPLAMSFPLIAGARRAVDAALQPAAPAVLPGGAEDREVIAKAHRDALA